MVQEGLEALLAAAVGDTHMSMKDLEALLVERRAPWVGQRSLERG